MQTRERNRQAFSSKGGSTGILMIHGFTGSPGELRPFAEHLAKLGYRVEVPILAGHCTTVHKMNETTYQDWVQSAYDAYHLLAMQTERVVCIGHSMGGLIAFYLANRYHIAGIVSMCTPVFLSHYGARLAPFISWLYPVHRTASSRNEELLQYLGGYDETPVRALKSLNRFIRVVRDELHEIHVPVLVQQAKKDLTVRPESAQYIYDHIRSKHKELKWYEHSGHMLPIDTDRKEVWADALSFISQIEGVS
ncbi:alpha/beta hydrolase [Sulfoacidibacillus thermotolerans]|uniref:Serine aminopeptidase S33 domain-containing protein n=1 Tax=Sulfoacidibacillus thermotolerans TaxID=1765684 RepID=A0A2U3D9B8_SULT2|nr:alpha/beta fold hydrolase [Sulfoacidibacillus thermotolerans]PWI57871.1 hypothetical protein BM613_06750 [Sulfoacidibacillus thermotolerans]